MVKHIVMWKFKEEIADADRAMIRENMKNNLEALVGQVPGLIQLKFQANLLPKSTHDMALTSEFTTPEALAGYSHHPAHVVVANTYVRPFVCNRSCLDYEVEK